MPPLPLFDTSQPTSSSSSSSLFDGGSLSDLSALAEPFGAYSEDGSSPVAFNPMGVGYGAPSQDFPHFGSVNTHSNHVSAPPSGLAHLLARATHQQLVAAQNAPYLNALKKNTELEHHLNGMREGYNMLLSNFNTSPVALDATGTIVAGNPLPPLAVTQTTWVTPDRSKYPKILFWTATEYNNHQEASKDSQASMKEEKPRRGKNPDLDAQRRGTAYLQHADGSWILEQEARAMTQFARSRFNDLRQRKMEAANWKGLSGQASRYIYQELYRAYNFLSLCDNHWKIEKFASGVYAGWFRQIREGSGGDGKRVKKEPLVEGKRKEAPTSQETTKPSKQIKSSTSPVDLEANGSGGHTPALALPSSDTKAAQDNSPVNVAVSAAPVVPPLAESRLKLTNPLAAALLVPPLVDIPIQQQPNSSGPSSDTSSPTVPPVTTPVAWQAPTDSGATTVGSAGGAGSPSAAEQSNPALPTDNNTSNAALAGGRDAPPRAEPALNLPLFKFNRSSAAPWNLFGREYASNSSHPPTKQEVQLAFENLPKEDKDKWAKIRLATLAAKKGKV